MLDFPDYSEFASDPVEFARSVLGFQADKYQEQVLDPRVRRGILRCTRGFGKTEITSILAAHHVATRSNATVLVVSETVEKAAELVQRTVNWLAVAGIEAKPDKTRRGGYRLANGSRILPVPNREGAVRGRPATLVLVDEAALVSERTWMALMGTRAATYQQSQIWLMSTPGAKRGFFYEFCTNGDPGWTRIHVAASKCDRIDKKFLEEQKRTMHPDDYRREFDAEFAEPRGKLYRTAHVLAVVGPAVKALNYENPKWHTVMLGDVLLANGKWTPRHGFYVAIDLGQARDHTAIAIVEYQWMPTNRVDPLTRQAQFELKLRLRWLQRLTLDTPYTDVADIVGRLMEHPEILGRATAVVDAGGARAFVDLVRSMKIPVVGVQITRGAGATTSADGMVNLPKEMLMMNLEAMIRLGDIQIAADCPFLKELLQEFEGFERVRMPDGKWSYSGKTHGPDDLVMALALAAGWAWERHRTGFALRERWRAADRAAVGEEEE